MKEEITIFENKGDEPVKPQLETKTPLMAEVNDDTAPESVRAQSSNKSGNVLAEIKFYGQHGDERILAEVKPHPFVEQLGYIKAFLAGLAIWIIMIIIGQTLPFLSGQVEPAGFWIGVVIMVLGALIVKLSQRTNIGYITDRRIVRFKSSSPFNINSRSLSWDEAVKVKTYSANWLLRMMNIGSLVVHAKSTVVQYGDQAVPKNTITDDDVELTDVHYYRDLGNFIDKILYLYKRNPEELQRLRPFVAKPRGKRD